MFRIFCTRLFAILAGMPSALSSRNTGEMAGGGARSSGSIFHDEQFVTGPIRPGKSVRGIGEKGFYLPWRESGNLSCYLGKDAVSLLLVSQ